MLLTLDLQPDATDGVDAVIASNAAGNAGTLETLTAGSIYLAGNTSYWRSLLRFDLSEIPPGAEIVSAELTLTAVNGVLTTSPQTFSVYRVTKAWLEDQVTWANYLTATAWATAGGDYDTDLGDSTSLADPTDDLVFDGLAEVVSDAVDDRLGSLDLILVGPATAGEGNYFIAASSDDATAANRPRLVVTYRPIAAVEQIARKVKARLANVTAANGYSYTAIVKRPDRFGGNWTLADKQLVLWQGDEQRDRMTDSGRRTLVYRWQEFLIAVLCINTTADKTTPIEDTINERVAEVTAALCTPEDEDADWATFDGLTCEAEFSERLDLVFEETTVGQLLPLRVLYRTPEDDLFRIA
jgi:hypothetical protein